MPANNRDFFPRYHPAWLRQTHRLAVEARRVGAKNDIHRFVGRERARRKRKRALERR